MRKVNQTASLVRILRHKAFGGLGAAGVIYSTLEWKASTRSLVLRRNSFQGLELRGKLAEDLRERLEGEWSNGTCAICSTNNCPHSKCIDANWMLKKSVPKCAWLDESLRITRFVREIPQLSFASVFLICRRARRQRLQSPILVTVRIDKHFKLYIDWSLSGKSKSSQLASQVMESTSKFLLIAQSAIRKAATVQSSYSRTATTHDCKNLQIWNQHRVATNGTCRRDFNC